MKSKRKLLARMVGFVLGLLFAAISPAAVSADTPRPANAVAMVFTESRENPIRPALGIQEAWKAQAGQLHPTFEGRARPGELFTFQVGVQVLVNVGPLGISFGDLTGNDGAITAGAIRCLSLNGTNCGSVLAKSISVAAGKLQALWVGMDVPMIARHLFGHGAIAVEQLDLAAGFHSIDGRRRGVDGSR